ncbi:MAG: carboxylating nicotinate-nucleotide diphosphorylase [Promethearchaeota archaeon]|nr:MAG: carboxylating nicotinate-nucleotide diphosphorylase [Candidatus Lokiarchaeota archaeon]
MSYNKFVIERKLKEFLEEDCNFVDVSANVIPKDAIISAKIISKNKGFISGLEELKLLYDILNISSEFFKNDGDKFRKGEIIVKLKGNARDILLSERTGLNLITHMSSITTTTKKFAKIIEDSGKQVKIACTRKTLPGLRIFEKKAVSLAGELADTHRFSLDDMILLKDTHLKFYNGNLKELLNYASKNASFSKKIEIEVEKTEDVLEAAENGANIIMLDNMSPDQVDDSIKLLIKRNLRQKVIVEVSGGITEKNIIDYILAKPDVISVGEITQFPSEKVDLALYFD